MTFLGIQTESICGFMKSKYIVSDGRTGMKNTSKLFVETVKLYSDNVWGFQSKHHDALFEIYGDAVSTFCNG